MGARMQAFVMTGVGDGSIRELDRRIFSGDIAIAFPVIGGHEVSGTVVEAMDNGCGLEVGDRVVLDVVNRNDFCGLGGLFCLLGQLLREALNNTF